MTIRNLMKALLNRQEDAPGADSCVLVTVTADRIAVDGFGREPDRTIALR